MTPIQFTRAQDADNGQWFRNFYTCPMCEFEWSDEWSRALDKDCPTCGTDVTPYDTDHTPLCLCGECTGVPYVRLAARTDP